ncbi:MAG: hypothetical protein IJG33_07095 [Selenomonadaceae bacterium]|nr:hypothetical protein [Selenomonadaceae bacterium]MBR0288751.1 hypothetical protein [Selenomonadaceae bacterium]
MNFIPTGKSRKYSIRLKLKSFAAQGDAADSSADTSTTQGNSTPPFTTKMKALQAELQEVKKSLKDFSSDRRVSVEFLEKIKDFNSDMVLSDDFITAAALVNLFDSKTFVSFKSSLNHFNRTTKDKKVSITEWMALVKERVANIKSCQSVYNSELMP